jgi:hypothetical protein
MQCDGMCALMQARLQRSGDVTTDGRGNASDVRWGEAELRWDTAGDDVKGS